MQNPGARVPGFFVLIVNIARFAILRAGSCLYIAMELHDGISIISKRLENMRKNPRSDWKIADVEGLCREFDILCKPVSGGGSHYKVGHPVMANKLTIPFKRPIKPVYIRQLVQFVDTVRNPP